MATILEQPPILRPPNEALRRLARMTPSDRALAEMLGTDNHSVAAWRKGARRMRRPYLDVIPRMDAIVDCLVAAGVEDADITYLLRSEWPPLGSKPAEALKEGELRTVLAAVPVMVGKEDALPPLPDDEQHLVDWLAQVMTREPELAAAVVDDDEDADAVGAGEWLSEAWRGGATMSSERWSRRR